AEGGWRPRRAGGGGGEWPPRPARAAVVAASPEIPSRGGCDPVTLRARQEYSLPTEKSSAPAPSPLFRALRLLIDVRPDEVAALAWSWLYFFSILSAYYVIRPIRDEIGAAGATPKPPRVLPRTLSGMLS